MTQSDSGVVAVDDAPGIMTDGHNVASPAPGPDECSPAVDDDCVYDLRDR